MRTRSVIVLAAVAVLFGGGAARADYSFVFADGSGNAQSNFTVAQGSTVDVRVYLVQSGTSTGLSSSGLASGGVGLTFNQSVVNLADASKITPNSAFDANSKNLGAGSASLNVSQVLNAPITAPTTGTDANRILLGTFTFSGVSAGTSLTVTADPHPGAVNDNVLGDGTALDALIHNSSAVITVTAVPEPGTLVLTGLLATGMAAGVTRRLRRPA
jgi:hypothetical protein